MGDIVDAVDGDPTTKAAWRAAIVAARRPVSREQRAEEAAALCDHLLAAVRPGTTVCAYVPVGSEPGSPDLLDALVGVDVRVLLPVAREVAGTPQPLAWGEYRPGRLIEAPFGLREPDAPWLPPEAIAAAAIVVVPALAVDHRGARLGRGAGFYDRSLALADGAAWLVAIVRDDELVDRLPHEDHDVPMTHALTPGGGLVTLGGSA
ncbi:MULTISPECIES: 5-formyltetrahydrofolate cyclo-ligase [unclassified Mycobacterium]|uniref:5-formyltetrahydrofolate cyclo-ligase n=1 Tax=unclassified Mycobacterium TaxID=2642494 RepID=UPI0029C770CB|nr:MULTISPECIES: 5-formyltetrahydrofolate cyclo-ligase [unclassified Mycobacterium]